MNDTIEKIKKIITDVETSLEWSGSGPVGDHLRANAYAKIKALTDAVVVPEPNVFAYGDKVTRSYECNAKGEITGYDEEKKLYGVQWNGYKQVEWHVPSDLELLPKESINLSPKFDRAIPCFTLSRNP